MFDVRGEVEVWYNYSTAKGLRSLCLSTDYDDSQPNKFVDKVSMLLLRYP